MFTNSVKVHAGDWGETCATIRDNWRGRTQILLPRGFLRGFDRYDLDRDVATVEVATEESVKRLAGTLGWGLAGALTLGAVGLLAGLIAGGKHEEVTFICQFTDGKKFLATTRKKLFIRFLAGLQKRASAQEHVLTDLQPALLDSRPAPSDTQHQTRWWLVLVLLILPFAFQIIPEVLMAVGLVMVVSVPLYLVSGAMRRRLGEIFRMPAARPFRGAFKLLFIFCYGFFVATLGAGSGTFHERAAEMEKRRQLADVQSNELLLQAIQFLEDGNVEEASRRLDEAVSHAGATRRDEVKTLQRMIRESGDASHTRKVLDELSDEEFAQFRSSGKAPPPLAYPYPALADRAIQLAHSQLDYVGTEREKRQRRAAAAQKALDDMLQAFVADLGKAGGRYVANVSVRRRGTHSIEATIVVRDTWHVNVYQVRLQEAQRLWQRWARIASPKEPDHARIKIVDLNGNEIGGSRALAGSLIWVQKD